MVLFLAMHIIIGNYSTYQGRYATEPSRGPLGGMPDWKGGGPAATLIGPACPWGSAPKLAENYLRLTVNNTVSSPQTCSRDFTHVTFTSPGHLLQQRHILDHTSSKLLHNDIESFLEISVLQEPLPHRLLSPTWSSTMK